MQPSVLKSEHGSTPRCSGIAGRACGTGRGSPGIILRVIAIVSRSASCVTSLSRCCWETWRREGHHPSPPLHHDGGCECPSRALQGPWRAELPGNCSLPTSSETFLQPPSQVSQVGSLKVWEAAACLPRHNIHFFPMSAPNCGRMVVVGTQRFDHSIRHGWMYRWMDGWMDGWTSKLATA